MIQMTRTVEHGGRGESYGKMLSLFVVDAEEYNTRVLDLDKTKLKNILKCLRRKSKDDNT